MYKKKIYVHCNNCHDDKDEEKVKFIDIEENIQGQDVMTFICPDCGKRCKSLRRG